MVIDTSALLAILQAEKEKDALLSALLGDPVRLVSAATMLEASIVVAARGGEDNVEDLDRFVRDAEIEIVPLDTEQLAIARHAWRRFGKGNHRAGLNFGDCMSYALARQRREPLLFKGDDFARTDIDTAWG
jgi:ribonuclease VapC